MIYYGNIIQIDKESLTYNSRNLIDSYTISNNEKYDLFYNYQGMRYRKVKESDYTVNCYLDNIRIIVEDVLDFNDEMQTKFRYFYDAWGNCETAIFNEQNASNKDNVNYNPFRYKG